MARVFRITQVSIEAEEDNYTDGCVPETRFVREFNTKLYTFDSIEDAIESLSGIYGLEENPNNWSLQLEGAGGTLRFNRLEDGDDNPVMRGILFEDVEVERRWKAGEINLFSVNYEWQILAEIVIQSPILPSDAPHGVEVEVM